MKELELEATEEARARIENIDELISKVRDYDDNAENPSLSGFLEEVALVADIDNLEEESNRVVLMTLHSAKGLEFPYVYMAGMEEGLFPSYMSIMADNPQEEIEEERRLCYVGITRAKKELTLTAARQRMVRGEVQYNQVSRFIREIPEEYLDAKSESPGRRAKEEWETRKEKRREAFLTQRSTVPRQALRDGSRHGHKGRPSGIRRGRPGPSSALRRGHRAGNHRGPQGLRGPGELRHGRRQEAVRLLREAEKDLGNDSNFGIDVV